MSLDHNKKNLTTLCEKNNTINFMILVPITSLSLNSFAIRRHVIWWVKWAHSTLTTLDYIIYKSVTDVWWLDNCYPVGKMHINSLTQLCSAMEPWKSHRQMDDCHLNSKLFVLDSNFSTGSWSIHNYLFLITIQVILDTHLNCF